MEWERGCRQMERSPAAHALGMDVHSFGLEEEQSALASSWSLRIVVGEGRECEIVRQSKLLFTPSRGVLSLIDCDRVGSIILRFWNAWKRSRLSLGDTHRL